MKATHISSTQHPSRPAWTDVFTAIKSLPALPLEENQLKGWFFGFKLHGVCSEKGAPESVIFTSGNINDSKMIETVSECMKGFFYSFRGVVDCYAGYLKKCKDLVSLAEAGRFICAAARQNMSRLISDEQWSHLRKRNIIKSDRVVLKQNCFPEYHQSRSMDGIFRHHCFALSAYMLQCRLKAELRLKTRI